MSTPHPLSTTNVSRPSCIRQIAGAALLMMTATIALPSNATVVVNNFNPDGGFDPLGTGVAAHISSFGRDLYIKSAFSFTVLGGDYYLDTITIALRHAYNNSNNLAGFTSGPYSLSLYESINNLPGGMLESVSNASIPANNTTTPTAFNFSGSTKLVDGQTYWIVSSLPESQPQPQPQPQPPSLGMAQDSYTVGRNTTGSTVPFIQMQGSPGQPVNWASRIPFNDQVAFRVDGTAITAAVPEPETYAMLLAGLGVVGMMGRRRTNTKKAA